MQLRQLGRLRELGRFGAINLFGISIRGQLIFAHVVQIDHQKRDNRCQVGKEGIRRPLERRDAQRPGKDRTMEIPGDDVGYDSPGVGHRRRQQHRLQTFLDIFLAEHL